MTNRGISEPSVKRAELLVAFSAAPVGDSGRGAGPGPDAAAALPPPPAHLARHPAMVGASLPEAPAVAVDSPHQLLLVGEIHLPDEGAVAEDPHGGPARRGLRRAAGRPRAKAAAAAPSGGGAAPVGLGRLWSLVGAGAVTAAREPFIGPDSLPHPANDRLTPKPTSDRIPNPQTTSPKQAPLPPVLQTTTSPQTIASPQTPQSLSEQPPLPSNPTKNHPLTP